MGTFFMSIGFLSIPFILFIIFITVIGKSSSGRKGAGSRKLERYWDRKHPSINSSSDSDNLGDYGSCGG